jgi:predicted ATPase/class 3 adenylate cyclase
MKCGAKIEHRCASCKTINPVEANFCRKCGTALTPRAGPLNVSATEKAQRVEVTSEQQAEGSDGECKTVTALFADIKGSMELMEDLDPEEARAIVDPALKLMIEAVQHYGGHVVQSTGDGVFALFGAPAAYEDHPQRALYTAVRMQEEIRCYGDRMRTEGQTPLQVRIGINTGEVVMRSIQTSAGHAEYTPIGHSTNLAARLQTLATPGSTVISGHMRGLVEGYFQLKALGPTRIKGVSESVEVFEVTGLGPLRTRLQVAARRGLTKFVGRQREMEALRHAAELAKSGHGQLVAVMGEPGEGKSRLFHEFKLISQSEWITLEAFSLSYGKATAYLPLLELLREYFRIISIDDLRTRREKVTGRVLALDRSLEDTLPYLFALLALSEGDDRLAQMDAQVRRRRTHEAIKRILLRESLNQPLIVIFEDLHWIDQHTQEFLNLLADSIGTAKILLLVNYRPEYSHQWNSKTYYAQLRLDPLARESAEQMLTSLLGEVSELAPLRSLIIEKTEGTPFFMEEIVQALFEEGTLVGNGVVKLVRPLTRVTVPATVQAVLASRIDRLPADDKELLQALAVLGREFRLGLVRQVTRKSNDELETRLLRLQVGEFIYEQPASEPEYIFKHALTQQVAYQSLLIEQRKQIHESAGQALESMYAEQLDDHLSELAYHYGHSANASKAIEYLYRASEQAIERSANQEAIADLTAGLDMIQKLPDDSARKRQESSFQLALGGVLAIATNPANPQVERAFSRARELSAQMKDDARLFHALAGLWYRHQVGGLSETALEAGEELLSLARRSDDPIRLKFAHSAVAQALMSLGHVVAAVAHIEQSESIICPEQRTTSYHIGDAPSRWLAISAVTFWLAGYPDQALARSRDALKVADKLSHGYVSTVTRLFYGLFCVNSRCIQDVLGQAEVAIALAMEYGFSNILPHLLIQRGWALVQFGRVEEGFDQINHAIAIWPPTTGRGLLRYDRLLADACLQAKRTVDGLRAVDEGLENV